MALLELHDVNYQTDDRLILNQITLSVEKVIFNDYWSLWRRKKYPAATDCFFINADKRRDTF